MSYQKANAVRIWQNEDTKVERQAPFSFLWDTVAAMEADAGSGINWQNQGAKTYLYLVDGSCCWVLGSFKRWEAKWDRYLRQSEQRTLLFAN